MTNINQLVSESFFSKKVESPINISGRIVLLRGKEEIKPFWSRTSKIVYTFGIILEVPKEISARDSGGLEFYSIGGSEKKDITNMKVGEHIPMMLEAERGVNNLIDMFKSYPKDVCTYGKFKGSGILQYYSHKSNFTFTTSLSKGTFNLTYNKPSIPEYILQRIK